MVNTHFHSPGNFLKGAVPSLPLELFMLYEVPPFMAEPVSGRYAYLRTMLGAIDMLKQGVTAVHDDAYYLPVATRDEISAVFGAYRDSGIRATVTIDQPNVAEYEKHAFFADRLPPDVRAAMDAAPRQDDAELLRLYDWMLGQWHADGGRQASRGRELLGPAAGYPDLPQGAGPAERRLRHPVQHAHPRDALAAGVRQRALRAAASSATPSRRGCSATGPMSSTRSGSTTTTSPSWPARG